VTSYRAIARDLAADGLIARGGFHPEPADAAPEGCATVILVGNAGGPFWAHFERGRRAEPDPLDRWTMRAVSRVAAKAGGWAVYPSDGPPYFPFQRWAMRAEPVHPSPLGLLIHPDHGLWHAYRAAICLYERLAVPLRENRASPCETCTARPCLQACPAGAFSEAGYDTGRCSAHLHTPAGAECVSGGCKARHACPVTPQLPYAPGQAAFHMRAFLAARSRKAEEG
jgi:hypothetical protein